MHSKVRRMLALSLLIAAAGAAPTASAKKPEGVSWADYWADSKFDRYRFGFKRGDEPGGRTSYASGYVVGRDMEQLFNFASEKEVDVNRLLDEISFGTFRKGCHAALRSRCRDEEVYGLLLEELYPEEEWCDTMLLEEGRIPSRVGRLRTLSGKMAFYAGYFSAKMLVVCGLSEREICPEMLYCGFFAGLMPDDIEWNLLMPGSECEERMRMEANRFRVLRLFHRMCGE